MKKLVGERAKDVLRRMQNTTTSSRSFKAAVVNLSKFRKDVLRSCFDLTGISLVTFNVLFLD